MKKLRKDKDNSLRKEGIERQTNKGKVRIKWREEGKIVKKIKKERKREGMTQEIAKKGRVRNRNK